MAFLGAFAPMLLSGGTQGISNILGAPQTIFNSITGTNNQGQGQGQGQGQSSSDPTILIIAGVAAVALIILIKK
jgi:hypothetical protein